MDFDDCMQTAAEVFARITNRYGETINTPQWWMGMFKLSLSREFHTYSTECTQKRTAEHDYVEEAVLTKTDIEHEASTFSLMLIGASDELKDVMTAIASAPSELLSVLLKESDDAGWSRKLCRLCRTKKINETIISELRSIVNGHSGEGYSLYNNGSSLTTGD
jgi:hypothetical protein